jgi:hypothetical protein
MEVVEQRPRLVSLRVTRFQGDNSASAAAQQKLSLALKQEIEVGLGTSIHPNGLLMALVSVVLHATARTPDGADTGAVFEGRYEGKFEYPAGVTEEVVGPRFATEPYQYVLVAQVVPLAMTHFRRELQAMGLDARELPLGI